MKNIKYAIFGLVILIIALVLTFYWYDYKLFLILFLMLWGNNIQRSNSK